MHRSPLIGWEDWWPWQLYPLSATSPGGGDLSNLRFTPLEEETKRHRRISRGRVSPILSGISQLPSYRCHSSSCHGNCYHGAECAGSPCHLLFSHSFTFHLSPLPPYLNGIKLNTHTQTILPGFFRLSSRRVRGNKGWRQKISEEHQVQLKVSAPCRYRHRQREKRYIKKKKGFLWVLNASERIILKR